MLSVLATSVSVWPAALVNGPAPLTVDPTIVNVVAVVVSALANVAVEFVVASAATAGVAPLKAAVVPLNVSVPAPLSVALTALVNVPLVTASVRAAPIVIVPVLVKLGAVPVCARVRFPPTRSIVPPFVCAALARASVSGTLSVSVP